MLWFYVITRYEKRTLAPIAKTCGVVSAEGEDVAMELIEDMISENATLDFIKEIDPKEPCDYTVYRSSFGTTDRDD